MKKLTLIRYLEANGATLGILDGLSKEVFTLEDAWRNNQRRISCIPAGTYKVTPHGWEKNTPFKYKRTWRLLDVPNRSAILIHAGNFHKDTEGCVLVGMGLSIAGGVSMLKNSREAIELFRKEIGENGFTLEIVDRVVKL